jgi:hypothetical protein
MHLSETFAEIAEFAHKAARAGRIAEARDNEQKVDFVVGAEKRAKRRIRLTTGSTKRTLLERAGL